ncbi:hypothetical protein AA0120_g10734 [Alternaria tenuissima]|nr:hypothetical protein AA0120_g10734 [Alternaria tenuissima]
MATRTIIPPLARGDSKPIDANKPFIIRDLPAEIRNQIISYLVEYPTPMRISCNSTESRPYRIDIHGFRLCPKLQLPVNLFASCRTLYRDAGSAFYSNHTFIIDSRYCSYSCHRYSPIIRLPGAFFTRIGTQAQWLRKIELDLCLLTKSKLYRSLAHPDRVKYGALERFEITPFLRAIWDLDLNVDVSLVNTRYFPPIHGLTDLDLNAPSMSAIFKSILGGQLGLRKYGRLLYAVTICGDGSGGEISWGTTKLCCDPPNMMIRELLPDIIPDLHHISSFTAKDGGARLRVHKREKALTLLDLPQPILRDIIRRIVHPIEGFVIHLDKDTKFNCGIIHVNKDIYHAWRDSFLFGHSSFELVLTTNCVHTDFGGFKKLRRVLRKTFDSSRYPPDDSSHLRTLTISAFRRNTVNYTLKFEVQGPVSLGDVRINILPFVMETAMSDSSNGNELTIQVQSTGCNGPSTMTASHTMGLEGLHQGGEDVDAKFLYLEKEMEIVPDCWINGFGQVVQVVQVEDAHDIAGEAWEFASHLVENDCKIDHGCWETRNCFDVLELHPLDRHYRHGDIHPGCSISGKQFFPFQRNAKEVMRYLLHNIDDHGVFDS